MACSQAAKGSAGQRSSAQHSGLCALLCAVACLQAPLVLAAGHKQQQGGLHKSKVMPSDTPTWHSNSNPTARGCY
jgi:hypothetical protein